MEKGSRFHLNLPEDSRNIRVPSTGRKIRGPKVPKVSNVIFPPISGFSDSFLVPIKKRLSCVRAGAGHLLIIQILGRRNRRVHYKGSRSSIQIFPKRFFPTITPSTYLPSQIHFSGVRHLSAG